MDNTPEATPHCFENYTSKITCIRSLQKQTIGFEERANELQAGAIAALKENQYC
jgi:hypothetical protein